MTESLKSLREQIDKIDTDLVTLLNERAELVLEVKRAKKRENAEIYSPERERRILDRVRSLAAEGNFPAAALERIFVNIISATRSLIGETSVAFLGSEHSLARDAATDQFGQTVRFVSEDDLHGLVRKVEEGEVQYGLVPIRNTEGGLIYSTFDELMRSKLVIIAETPAPDGSEARYVTLGHKPPTQTGTDKTTLVCGVNDRAGALRDLLQPFASRSITLLRIESKPDTIHGWDYLFFIDIAGHQGESTVAEAIAELSDLVTHLKVLGSYPMVCTS